MSLLQATYILISKKSFLIALTTHLQSRKSTGGSKSIQLLRALQLSPSLGPPKVQGDKDVKMEDGIHNGENERDKLTNNEPVP